MQLKDKGILKASNKVIVNEKGEEVLLRGFGLGGWLLPEGYMWKLYTKCDRPRKMEQLIKNLCGESYNDYFWETYYNNYITKEDIKLIKQQGFNSIRLPINGRTFNLELIDKAVNWCRELDIYVILDMHGAVGGQTGTNIDDSENDLPELYTNEKNQHFLIEQWKILAEKYKNDYIIAGYDLLNEPLPNWFSEYNGKVMPLYRKIIEEIRKIDKEHIIILEGVHWATDISIFEELKENPINNIVLEFHKYWSHPDKESIYKFLDFRNQYNIPLFMGEGGENNLRWYTTVFSMYDRENISWNFWTYKKMDCENSPISFEMPQNWQKLIKYIDGEDTLLKEEALEIFEDFLNCIKNKTTTNYEVFNSLNTKVPLTLPCECFHNYTIENKKVIGATVRESEEVSILFRNGKSGDVDYKRYGGEEQPKDERICVFLRNKDKIIYKFRSDFENIRFKIKCKGNCKIIISLNNYIIEETEINTVEFIEKAVHTDKGIDNNLLTFEVVEGEFYLEYINIDFE